MVRLSLLRRQMGLTQKDLSAILGIAQSTISGWENGKYEIDDFNKCKIADYFGVTVDYLLGRTDEPNSVDEAIANFRNDPQNKKAVLMKHGGGGEVLNVTDAQLAIVKEIIERDDSADDWRKAKAILDALKQTNE